jgi:hypothetical protein
MSLALKPCGAPPSPTFEETEATVADDDGDDVDDVDVDGSGGAGTEPAVVMMRVYDT